MKAFAPGLIIILMTAAGIAPIQVQGFFDGRNEIQVGSEPIAVAVNEASNMVYVASSGSKSLTVIDGSNNNISREIRFSTAPIALTANDITDRVYVLLQGNVTVLDGSDGEAITSFSVPEGSVAIAVNPSTDTLYVVDEQTSSILVLDENDGREIVFIKTDQTPEKLAVDPTSNKVYALLKDDNDILVIDGVENQPVESVSAASVGTKPDGDSIGSSEIKTVGGIAINPVTKSLYVTISVSGYEAMSIVEPDLRARTPGMSETVRFASHIQEPLNDAMFLDVAVNSILYRAYAIDSSSNLLYPFDGLTKVFMKPIKVGENPVSVAVNSKTNMIYVANHGSDTVSVLQDHGYRTVESSIAVGEIPLHLAINDVTNRIYIVNHNNDNVSVIDGSTNEVIDEIDFGGKTPRELAIDPERNLIYSTHCGAYDPSWEDDISVIDGGTDQIIDTFEVPNICADRIALNHHNGKLYLIDDVDNKNRTLTIVNSITKEVIKSIDLSTWPADIAINLSTGDAYVSRSGQLEILVIDGNSDEIEGTIAIEDTYSIEVNSNTNIVYAYDYSFIRTAPGPDNEVTGMIKVPGGSDRGIAIDSRNDIVYFATEYGEDASDDRNWLFIIDGKTGDVIDIAYLGIDYNIWNIGVNPNTGLVYVPDSVNNKVHVIDGSPAGSTTDEPNITVTPIPTTEVPVQRQPQVEEQSLQIEGLQISDVRLEFDPSTISVNQSPTAIVSFSVEGRAGVSSSDFVFNNLACAFLGTTSEVASFDYDITVTRTTVWNDWSDKTLASKHVSVKLLMEKSNDLTSGLCTAYILEDGNRIDGSASELDARMKGMKVQLLIPSDNVKHCDFLWWSCNHQGTYNVSAQVQLKARVSNELQAKGTTVEYARLTVV